MPQKLGPLGIARTLLRTRLRLKLQSIIKHYSTATKKPNQQKSYVARVLTRVRVPRETGHDVFAQSIGVVVCSAE